MQHMKGWRLNVGLENVKVDSAQMAWFVNPIRMLGPNPNEVGLLVASRSS